MAEEKPDKKEGITPENLPVLAKIFSYERYEDIDTKKIAAELGVSQQRVAGMAGVILNDPNAWEEAKKAYGYHDDQKPAWVGAGKEAVAAVVKEAVGAGGAVEAPGSRKAPRTAATAKVGQENVTAAAAAPAAAPAGAAITASTTAPQTASSASQTAPQTAQAAAFDAANRALGPGGQRIEALGSDALQRWMQENGVEERDGGYWQRRVLPTGEAALVEVKPPREVLEANRMGSAEISTMMYRALEGETQALMKKVAFNPEAFTH